MPAWAGIFNISWTDIHFLAGMKNPTITKYIQNTNNIIDTNRNMAINN